MWSKQRKFVLIARWIWNRWQVYGQIQKHCYWPAPENREHNFLWTWVLEQRLWKSWRWMQKVSFRSSIVQNLMFHQISNLTFIRFYHMDHSRGSGKSRISIRTNACFDQLQQFLYNYPYVDENVLACCSCERCKKGDVLFQKKSMKNVIVKVVYDSVR